MDGGVDAVYMKMFDGIEPKVKKAIAAKGDSTFIDRPFLAIGKAIVVPASINAYIVSAPTMFLPCDVSSTHNAYHATYAAIKACVDYGNIIHVVIPGMATGIGKIPTKAAAEQMITQRQTPNALTQNW